MKESKAYLDQEYREAIKANKSMDRNSLDTMSNSNLEYFFMYDFIIEGDSVIMQIGDSLHTIKWDE